MNKTIIFTLLSAAMGVSSWSVAAEPNLALGKPVTASSIEKEFLSAARVVDGASNTRWSSDFQDDNWIMVDLQGQYELSQVKLHWQNSYAKDYNVQISDNANDWTPVKSVVNGDGGVDEHAISGQGRYVRIEGTRRATRWGYSLWELEVYGDPIVENISEHKPVFASSEEKDRLSAANAVDGRANTRWSSDFNDHNWIYVDLGDKHQITQVNLHWQSSYAVDYEIQTSNDALQWQTIRTVTDSDGGLDALNVDGHGRYLRVEGFSRATRWGHSLWELEVFGYAASQPGLNDSGDAPQEDGGTGDHGGSGDGGSNDGSTGEGDGRVDTQAPSAPAQLQASHLGEHTLTLNWTAATDNQGVLSYEVFRDGVFIAELLAPTQAFTDVGLTAGRSYQYSVRASDLAGNWSAESASVRVNTLDAQSSDDRGELVEGSVALGWRIPDQRANGDYLETYEIGGYEVRYHKLGEEEPRVKIIEDAVATSVQLEGLSGHYEFSIAVYDTDGLYSTFVPLTPQS